MESKNLITNKTENKRKSNYNNKSNKQKQSQTILIRNNSRQLSLTIGAVFVGFVGLAFFHLLFHALF
jgi:hypothetical protein